MKLPQILKGKRRALFVWLLSNAAGQAGLLFLKAMLIRFAFDRFLHGGSYNQDHVLIVGTALAASALGTGWLQRNERVIAERLGQSYIHSLRMRLFRHISRMDKWRLQKKRRGAVMLKFVGDLNALRRWVGQGMVRLVVSSAIIIGTMAVLFMIDWFLSGVAALIILAALIINVRIGETLRGAARDTRRRRATLSANINEKISQMSVVQVFGQRNQEIKRVRRQSYYLRKALINKASLIGLIRGITQGGTALAVTVVLIIGILKVHAGQTTAGTVAAAMIVIGFLVPALKNTGRIYENYQDAAVARNKLVGFLETPARISLGNSSPQLPPGRGTVSLENITVEGILKDVTAEAAAGEVIAIIGPNGAGKSVLIDLVARLVTPDKGKILIDGHDISAFSLESVRRAVGIVSPDLPLLAGTLDMNLRYRSPDSPALELERIRKLCGIDDLLKDLPRKAHTRIQEGGRNLSAGQRQRIQLARALLGAPRILLLDEADAHMDGNSKQVLNRVIRHFEGTILWVTHQQVPLVGVDAIWRVDHGRISTIPLGHMTQRAASEKGAA